MTPYLDPLEMGMLKKTIIFKNDRFRAILVFLFENLEMLWSANDNRDGMIISGWFKDSRHNGRLIFGMLNSLTNIRSTKMLW